MKKREHLLSIRALTPVDWPIIARIYQEGIDTGVATFETEVPDWNTWNEKYISECRLGAVVDHQLVGFAVVSSVSQRAVYKGVAEVTLYIDHNFRGRAIGKRLLQCLIVESEAQGIWTLQASIFPENIASIQLHKGCGFREVGLREKIGQRHGQWYDNMLLERRSKSNL